MSLKLVGGTLAVLALAAILYFHGHKHEAPPAPAPVVKIEPAPVSPAPTPVKPAPTPKKIVVGPPLKITPPVAPAAKKPLDMSVSCRVARSVTAGKTPEQLKEMREQYHTSDEEIARYKHCF